MKSYKLYYQICQESLREFFAKVPDRTFPNLVKEFYSNLSIVGTYLRSSFRGVKIEIHKDNGKF